MMDLQDLKDLTIPDVKLIINKMKGCTTLEAGALSCTSEFLNT